MKFLPTADSSLFGWEDLFILIVTALLAAVGVFVWAIYFKKKRRHKKGRRRRYSYATTINPDVVRTNGTPSAPERQNAPGEPKS